MIKRILVSLDPSPYADAATQWALMMAKRHQAEVTGLVILDEPGIHRSIGPVPLGGQYYAGVLQQAKEKEARAHIHTLLNQFAEKCDREGVPHSESERQGSPSDRIVEEAVFYDAIVIGLRTFFHFETTETPGSSLTQVLDQSITPVYAVPKQVRLPSAPSDKMKVLLAFDGSHPAARALHRFAQLAMPDAMEVALLMSTKDRADAEYYLEQAALYLQKHSFIDIKKEWTPQPIEEVMEDKWLKWSDLVVVGAHSQKFLTDFFLGSFTKYLIRDERKPLLIVP